MSEQTLSIDGVTVPRFLYGTAWKHSDHHWQRRAHFDVAANDSGCIH